MPESQLSVHQSDSVVLPSWFVTNVDSCCYSRVGIAYHAERGPPKNSAIVNILVGNQAGPNELYCSLSGEQCPKSRYVSLDLLSNRLKVGIKIPKLYKNAHLTQPDCLPFHFQSQNISGGQCPPYSLMNIFIILLRSKCNKFTTEGNKFIYVYNRKTHKWI